jgi:hypothetical protein
MMMMMMMMTIITMVMNTMYKHKVFPEQRSTCVNGKGNPNYSTSIRKLILQIVHANGAAILKQNLSFTE